MNQNEKVSTLSSSCFHQRVRFILFKQFCFAFFFSNNIEKNNNRYSSLKLTKDYNQRNNVQQMKWIER